MSEIKLRDHPKAPHNQPFKGAPKKKHGHWSNNGGTNNKREKQ